MRSRYLPLPQRSEGAKSNFVLSVASYGHGDRGVAEFLATGAVVGLLKSAELLFVSVQLTLRMADRASGSRPPAVLVENGAEPAPSKHFGVFAPLP